jgi:hypothetical protein
MGGFNNSINRQWRKQLASIAPKGLARGGAPGDINIARWGLLGRYTRILVS